MSAPHNTQRPTQPDPGQGPIRPEVSGFARADQRRAEAGLSFEKVLRHARARHLTYARAVEELIQAAKKKGGE
jgi:hypothetical protein